MKFYNAAFWAMSLFLVGVLCASLPAEAGALGGTGNWLLASWLVCGLGSVFLFLLGSGGEDTLRQSGTNSEADRSQANLVIPAGSSKFVRQDSAQKAGQSGKSNPRRPNLKKTAALLIFAAALGGSYYVFYDQHLAGQFTAPIGQQIELTGMVKRVSQIDSGQQVDIKISSLNNSDELLSSTFRLYAKPFPELKYGDVVSVSGVLKPIEGPSSGYYAKEGIGAVMSFPKKLEITAHDQGSRFFAVLYKARDYVRHTFEQILPGEQATLMTGLVIGKSSGFSKEFSEKLKITGTTHLVALSGYNISTVLNWFTALFGFFLLRKRALWFSIAAVIAFVLMTGAEASVVRAAIMATIMVVAERSERVYVARNAIVFTALLMILINPRLLAFDIGFQLSFAALIGIVYVAPALAALLRLDLKKKPGVLKWRENLITTFSAQIAVLPILMMNFGFITPISILTNVLLLSFIPATMVLGVIVLGASLLGSHVAFFTALPARIFLGYELGVINIFSKINFGFTTENFSVVLALIYYGALTGFILWRRKKAAL